MIPENLFAGVAGAPIHAVFNSVFQNCYGLTGEIPEDLFAGMSGAPAYRMYDSTFEGCSGLNGESAKMNGEFLYDIWPHCNMGFMYRGATGLSDYVEIPDSWN